MLIINSANGYMRTHNTGKTGNSYPFIIGKKGAEDTCAP